MASKIVHISPGIVLTRLANYDLKAHCSKRKSLCADIGRMMHPGASNRDLKPIKEEVVFLQTKQQALARR